MTNEQSAKTIAVRLAAEWAKLVHPDIKADQVMLIMAEFGVLVSGMTNTMIAPKEPKIAYAGIDFSTALRTGRLDDELSS